MQSKVLWNWFLAKIGQNTKPIALLFWPILTNFQRFWLLQSKCFEIGPKLGQNTKPIALLFGQNWPILSTFHCKIKIFEIDFWSKLAKYQAYSLTFWPKLAHFKHFSLQNQNLWNWFLVKIGQNTKPIALLFGQNWPILSTFHS